MTLENVAEHFYVSKATVSHLFSRKLGVPFYRLFTKEYQLSPRQFRTLYKD